MNDSPNQRSSGRPNSASRRKLLVAAGFGAANVVILRQLGLRPSLQSTSQAGAETLPVGGTEPVGPPALAAAGPEPAAGQIFDTVIAGGRVIDPDSGFDQVADVGLLGVSIAAIGDNLQGTTRIDATGQVVAPGFIDLLSYEPNSIGVWFKAADGVTTNMAMHGVNNYANAFFGRYEGKTPIHFGGAWHQHFIRGHDPQVGAVKPDKALDEAQIAAFAELTGRNLDNGLAGVAFSPEYSPATTSAEIMALARVAAQRGHVVFFHVRYSDPEPPGTSFEAIDEVLAVAADLGVAVHVEHIASTGGTFVMEETIGRLQAARDGGVDVTADVYPYDFWGTTLASHRFAGDWQGRYRISYQDLQIAGTETRLTEATFGQAKAENKLVAALGSIPEADVQAALKVPWIMIGSDSILTESLNHHPRGAGTFARVLGRYVRELGVLTLPDALAKMTILPARRLESMVPALAKKGRLQRGADADVVVFDPATVGDRATVEIPNAMSVGFSHLFVDGQAVMIDGELQRSVLAGRPLRSG